MVRVRNLLRRGFGTIGGKGIGADEKQVIAFGVDALQQRFEGGNVQILVKSPRYFDQSGMVKPFERPSMLVMGISSIFAMFMGTFIMDYLYFEVWVSLVCWDLDSS